VGQRERVGEARTEGLECLAHLEETSEDACWKRELEQPRE